MTNAIQKTKNYDQFKTLEGNRPINARHLGILTVAIAKNNMLAVNPILVNEDMYVIDGQHRLEVARNNDLEIYYLTLTGATIDQVIELNANLRAWTAKDFILSYANRGNKAYQWLLSFMEDYKLTITQALMLVYGNAGEKGIKYSNIIIRRGKFDPSQEQKKNAERRADALSEIRPFINIRGLLPVSFFRGIVVLDSEGLLSQLVKKMRDRALMVVPRGTMREDEALLRDILK